MARLEEICSINMGQSPESSSYNKNGEGMPFFQGNADFGELHPMVRIWCNAPTKIAECGDILISVRAPIGALNIADKQCCIGRGLAALTVNEAICFPRYLLYCLECKVDELNSKGTGSTFKAINKQTLSETEIPLPPLEEQRRIAATLDKVNDLIAKRRAQLDELDLLVKARFVEMFGDPVLNPMKWPEQPLKNIADIVSGITKGRKTKETELIEVPYMAVSNVKDGYIDWTTVKTILATKSEIEQYRLLPNDVLMTEGGDPDKVGRGAIIKRPLENSIHQNHIFRVRLNEDIILPSYFAEYLQHNKAKQYFLRCAKQTTGIASINMKQIKELPTLLPPQNMQLIYDYYMRGIDCNKLIISRGLNKLVVLKKSLIQKYFG